MQFTEKQKEDIFFDVCLEIANTSHGLKKICDEGRKLNKNFPCRKTIFNWMHGNKLFKDLYDDAKKFQTESLIDDMIEIADNTSGDFYINNSGHEVYDKEAVMRSRVKIDTRKWIASKLLPSKYGDDKDAKIAQLEQQLIEIQRSLNGS